MSTCTCLNQSDFFEIHPGQLEDFVADLVQLDERSPFRLYSCPSCGTLWIVDYWMRGPMAVRAAEREDWQDFDERPYRRQLVIEHHGGLGDATCLWRGCNNKVLRGMAFCPDHVYPQFAK